MISIPEILGSMCKGGYLHWIHYKIYIQLTAMEHKAENGGEGYKGIELVL